MFAAFHVAFVAGPDNVPSSASSSPSRGARNRKKWSSRTRLVRPWRRDPPIPTPLGPNIEPGHGRSEGIDLGGAT